MRIPVVGLLGRPGQRKPWVQHVPPEAFGEEPWGPAVDALEGSLAIDVVLEAISGGILVRGTIEAEVRSTCARCLAPTHRRVAVDVFDVHRAVRGEPDDHESGEDDDLEYELVDGDTHLELDQMVRDALVIGQPVRVLCRPDCAGLCPECGVDRNVERCDHGQTSLMDPRWAALKGLRLPPAAPDGQTDG